jgi:hypothetical protein|nr:MAG TPA: Protein of unknown function (DUF2730) [Caudoviricetes sp.]
MGEFILKYWVEVLFGIVVTGGGFLLKHHFKLFKESLDHKTEERDDKLLEKMTKVLTASNKTIQDSIDKLRSDTKDDIDGVYAELVDLKDDIKNVRKDVESIRRGVLDVQGPQFKAKCKEVLQDSHQITVDEWLALKKEYEIYTGMGGNSDGSELYKLVHEKYSKHLGQ